MNTGRGFAECDAHSAAHRTRRGWRVVERTELDSGGFLILVQQDEKRNSEALVIDPDTSDPGYTKVVATVFP